MNEIQILKDHHQEQVLRYFDELSPSQKEHLLSQVAAIDFSMIDQALSGEDACADAVISPIDTMTKKEWTLHETSFREEGCALLRQHKAAVIVLAGGQGSRLGFDGPKGTLDVGITRPLYLFEILLDNLRRNLRQAGGEDLTAPFYVMTSRLNHEATVRFFEEHDFFGYPKDLIRFYSQDMAPSLSYEGKILLEAKDEISMVPNGNGGWFTSLCRAGLLDQIKAEGIEWLNVVSVDNVLQNLLDPVFLGACSLLSYPAGAKVIAKISPDEKVGAICLKNGRPSVVEYSELTDEMRNARDAQGHYLYHYGVTLNYLFHVPETEQAAKTRLPIHKASKAVSCLDEQGHLVHPDKPNAWKLEYFIFDILESFDRVLSFECIREDEFAPIKNRTGVDSLESARALYSARTGRTL